MKIMIITDSYPPEVRSASLLMYELAHGLQSIGHSVTVMTTYPQYNLASDGNADSSTEEDGIKIIRCKTLPIHNISYFLRGIGHLVLPLAFYLKSLREKLGKLDYIFVYSPPITLGIVGIWLKRRNRAKLVVNIQDIFPQNAIDLGALKNKILIRFFEALEKMVYISSDVVTVHSESNKTFLTRYKDIEDSKVRVVHNWIDPTPFEQKSAECFFRDELNLNDKFVLLFAGVMGPSQGLHFLLKVAERLKELPDVKFLLVGDGTEKKNLLEVAREKGLDNVIFHHFVSKEEYPALVKSADVGVVCLTDYNRTPVVPGKILGYMAGGKPVLSALNKESDGHEIIRKANCGYSVVYNDLDGFVFALKKLYNDQKMAAEMGKSGRHYLLENFTKSKCIKIYEQIFSS